MTSTDQLTTIAGWKCPDPNCNEGVYRYRQEGQTIFSKVHAACNGTGYRFPDTVRGNRCPKGGKRPHWHFGQHYKAADDCNQGWNVSKDAGVWLEAIRLAGGVAVIELVEPHFDSINYYHVAISFGTPGHGNGQKPQLLDAIVAALEMVKGE